MSERYTPRIFTTYGICPPLDGPQRTAETSQRPGAERKRSGHMVAMEYRVANSPVRRFVCSRLVRSLKAVTPLLCYSPGADGPAEGPPVRPACCARESPEKRPVTTSSGSSRKRAYTREA